MSKTPAALYLVERVNFVPVDHVRVRRLSPLLRESARPDPFVTGALVVPIFDRHEGGTPVRAFLDRHDAARHADDLERAEWVRINPFYFGVALSGWTSLDNGRLCDWILDLDLDPPKAKRPSAATWRKWYDDSRARMSDLHLSKLRAGLDRVRFYRLSVLTPDETRIEDVVPA